MKTQKTFDVLCTKIGNLCFAGPKIDRDSFISALNELNCLNYRYTSIKTPTKALFLVTHLCSSVSAEDTVLVDKCSQFIMNLLRFQQVNFEGRTLMLTVDWSIQATNFVEGKVLLRVLEILGALVKNDSGNSVMLENVIKGIKNILEQINTSPEATVMALQCLESCVLPPSDSKLSNAKSFKHLEICTDIFVKYLCNMQSFDPLVYSKILGVCLIGLQHIICQHPKVVQNKLGILLGIVKCYMVYGLPEINFLLPQEIKPSTLMIPEIIEGNVKDKKGIRGKKTVKHRGLASHSKEKKDTLDSFGLNKEYKPATALNYNSDGIGGTNSAYKTSDSDFSDSEGGKLAKLNHSNSKIRQAALNLFYSINKQCEKSILFAYWTSFLPEIQTSGKHNLYTSILKDPSSRCRMGALNVVSQLLISFKSYLKLAEFSEKNTSFTSFSTVLGLILVELHKVLCLALNDNSVLVSTQVLKCMAALVQATPYHKMPKGLVSKVTRNVKIFVYSRDSSIQVTALIVMGCLIASEPTIPETVESITKIASDEKVQDAVGEISDTGGPEKSAQNFEYAQFSDDEDEVESTTSEPMSWLLRKCLSNLGVYILVESAPIPVKLESLQIISAIAQSYFKEVLRPHLDVVLAALESCLTDDSTVDIRLHAGRAVEFLGQAINKQLAASFEDSSGEPSHLQQYLQFWERLLSSYLVSLLQNEEHSTLRSIGCDCIGSVGPHIFQNLPRSRQILCMTLLFSSAKDGEKSVKGAAVRSLGVCILYPSLRDDIGFVIDTAEIILQCLKDDNLTVRVKASWSLGNLSDALVFNKNLQDTVEDLPDNLFLDLLTVSIKTSTDQDKIKMNVVRALGSFFTVISETHLEKNEFKNTCEDGLLSLIKNCSMGTNVKVRWNACYALGKALQNDVLYRKTDVTKWQANVFNTLTELVIGHNNFKVRINATNALASPCKREHYGTYFITSWNALLKALENSQNVVDFTEYKHRDHLIEQVCLGLAHLTTLLTVEDLTQIQKFFALYLDIFKIFVHKQLETLVPEKSNNFFSALCHLNDIKLSKSLDATEEKVIRQLQEIFTIDLQLYDR